MAAPIFKAFEEKAYKGLPVEPFRAPPGIRMVRIDRRSGKPVFGAWPSDDPLSPVIWEAFKPESEPRRAIKRDETEAEKPKEAAPVDQSRDRSEEHTSEIQSLMRSSYAVFVLKKKNKTHTNQTKK